MDRAHDHICDNEAGQDGNDAAIAREVLDDIIGGENDNDNNPILDTICMYIPGTEQPLPKCL